MADPLEQLRAARTPEAGWGYRAGEPSRVEPTAWALLAFRAHGAPVPRDAVAALVDGQHADGSWGGADGPDAPWVTAVAVLALRALGVAPEPCGRAETWLLEARSEQVVQPEGDRPVLNAAIVGWPWVGGCFGWVEPTAHAVTALRLARRRHPRLAEAIRFLNDRRCDGGGWNHGMPRVRDVDFPPYPNTTALGLIALATPGARSKTTERDLAVLLGFLREPLGLFDLAWAALALDANGCDPAPFLGRLGTAERSDGGWRENVHAVALAALARALPKGHNPFRLEAA
ncbi:MAG TPA: prenyltransferase/squalene oxidase repeat-containing protein [Candidatus Binatia bacterium]|jgi:hypothetical protein|nr:prenyltransferase/squalene oxidase repeat-containing protein [Candidatus Binatia bacterium]